MRSTASTSRWRPVHWSACSAPTVPGRPPPCCCSRPCSRPRRGSARVFGHDVVRERSAVRAGSGLLFQETSVDGLLTVEENLLFAARLAGLGGRLARAAVADTIARIGLTDREPGIPPGSSRGAGAGCSTSPGRRCTSRTSSSSTSRRSGSTPSTARRSGRCSTRSGVTHGTTILFSTHYLAEAEPADRVVLLAQGRVVADDAPAALSAELGERSPRSRARAPSGLRARSAGSARRGWCCARGEDFGSASAASGSRSSSWRVARPASSGSRFARPRSRTSISRGPRRTGSTAMSTGPRAGT